MKLAEDDTTSRGSAGGRSQGARKRKAIADANETRKVTRQSPRLSAKSGQSAGSDNTAMRSGSQPHKHKLEFADALVAAPAPEEKKARERVEAQKRRNTKSDPEEGNAGKKDEFVIRPTFDTIGRELISLMAKHKCAL